MIEANIAVILNQCFISVSSMICHQHRLFQVVFEGVVGNGYQGDIAVDDISILNGKCLDPGLLTI